MAKNNQKPNAAKKVAAGTKEGTVLVRILADHHVDDQHFKPNHVLQCPSAYAASLVRAGYADDHEDAVAHALEIDGNEIQQLAEPELEVAE